METTKCNLIKIHEKKNKKILIAISLIAVALIALIGLLIYNSEGSRINRAIGYFNQGVEWSEERSAYFFGNSDYEVEEIENQLERCLEKLDLKESYFEYTDNIYSEITVGFMNKYIQKYSFDNLIYGISMLKYYSGMLNLGFPQEKFFVVNDDLYNHFKDKFKDSSMYKLNSEGFYTENPDAEPQPWSKQNEVSGNFNNADDGNSVYSKTRTFTDTGRVYYYGDFAIEEITTHGYDEGEYGWYNGEFRDEPAHFTTRTDYVLYYKGKQTSIDVESSELPELNFYISEDENYIYVVYESSDYDTYHGSYENSYYKRTGKAPMNIEKIYIGSE